ncbi:MAG: hypothetical protein ACYTGN_01015 [Planctomycetota bacterium]|jgi:hypothetical protein
MAIASGRLRPGNTTALVTVLALVMLGAMAFAVPPSRLTVQAGEGDRGYLVSHSRFSSVLASQIANDGYSMLAIDLSASGMGKEAAWRTHLDMVAEVQFPTWGWIDTRRVSADATEQIAAGANVAGLFVYGPGADDLAKRLRAEFGGLRVVPVINRGDSAPDMPHAVAMGLDDFVEFAGETDFPVLRAARLSIGDIEEARAAAKGSYLVARIPVK